MTGNFDGGQPGVLPVQSRYHATLERNSDWLGENPHCVLQFLDQPRAPPALVVNRKRGVLKAAGKGSMPADQLNRSPMTLG